MTCREQTAAIVECARQRMEPAAALRAHLAGCLACNERWRTERQLAGELSSLRTLAHAPQASAAVRRQALLQEFDRVRPAARPRSALPRWTWTLAAAAAILMAILAGREFGLRSRPAPVPATRIRALPKPQSILYEASFDASELSADDFVAVPFTPPLAQGELIRVIQTELNPEALTSMGIDFDPAGTGNIPVEMVVGGDGLPRAVRITEETQFQ